MAKLTKQEAKLHQEACELVNLDRDLTLPEREFVLEHWQESTTGRNTLDGAFFTPLGLARDFSIEVVGDRIIDLGAGIGRLSWECRDRWNGDPEIVCVEKNPEYVRVGRKVLPEATWVQADLLDAPNLQLGQFDCVISNPPFGAIRRDRPDSCSYTGRRFEYHTIAVAARLAPYGVFLVPQNSAPFRYSGDMRYRNHGGDAEYQRFTRATGIELEPSCGIDTHFHANAWHGVSPATEVVTCNLAAAVSATEAGQFQLDV